MSNYKEDKINQEIRDIVDGEVRGKLFPEGRFNEASVILKKMYMKYYNKLNDTATKYAILYHLALAEYHNNNNEVSKIFIEMIKEELETSFYYTKDLLRYARVLNLYNETHINEMSNKEYIESYYYIAECYETLNNYSERAVALCNIYRINKEYNKILDLIKQLIELNEENVRYYTMELLKDIKDNSLHNIGLKLINKSNIKIS